MSTLEWNALGTQGASIALWRGLVDWLGNDGKCTDSPIWLLTGQVKQQSNKIKSKRGGLWDTRGVQEHGGLLWWLDWQ